MKQALDEVAEVAGYLWQKGWAERNGGNLTLNITEFVDDQMLAMPAITERLPIGVTLPHLKGCWFYCKGTGKRMRDLARDPMAAGSIIRILDDCATYEIIADKCKGCTLCARVCPAGAITGKVKEAHVIDSDICIRCGQCVNSCRFGAIIVE